MKNNQSGFSIVEALLIVGVLSVIGGSGYALYNGRQAPKATSTPVANSSTKATTLPTGTTQNIDSLTAQDVDSETAIDNKHTATETTNSQSANNAAANIGGAYNESSL